jgi:hypothetical protein
VWRRWLPQDQTDWLLIAIMLLSTAVLLWGCSTGGGRSDGNPVPCESVLVLASPGSYVACPGAPPLLDARPH